LSKDVILTIGSKFEHAETIAKDIEIQPSIRVLWRVDEKSSLWGAIGRSLSTPSRIYRDITINTTAFSSPTVDPDGPGPLPAGAPVLISIIGDDEVESETVKTFELGYRSQAGAEVSFDGTLFYNRYDALHTSERSFAYGGFPVPTHAIILSTFDNQMQGKTYGIELSVKWQATDDWRVDASYSLIKINNSLLPGSTDILSVDESESTTPRHQFQLHSHWNISDILKLDMAAYYVDKINVRNVDGRGDVPGYTRFDLRLGWQLSKTVEVNLVGQNLLEDQHVEFLTTDVVSGEVPRSLYLGVRKTF